VAARGDHPLRFVGSVIGGVPGTHSWPVNYPLDELQKDRILSRCRSVGRV
jgi:hypothetical protein